MEAPHKLSDLINLSIHSTWEFCFHIYDEESILFCLLVPRVRPGGVGGVVGAESVRRRYGVLPILGRWIYVPYRQI